MATTTETDINERLLTVLPEAPLDDCVSLMKRAGPSPGAFFPVIRLLAAGDCSDTPRRHFLRHQRLCFGRHRDFDWAMQQQRQSTRAEHLVRDAP